jgi:hypothetical protein
MAIKIVRKPSTSFRIECEGCEAILEYGIHDIDENNGAIKCPCCKWWNDHRNRLKMPLSLIEKPKESEDTE